MSTDNGMALLGLPTKQFRKEERAIAAARSGFGRAKTLPRPDSRKKSMGVFTLTPVVHESQNLAKMERKGSCALEEKDPNLVI
jgi:hypothetical protein